jgi:hypothetical protein
MALGAAKTATYVEGADRVARIAFTGDSAYVTGGYDALAAILALPGSAGVVIKRIISWRHRTLASKLVGDPVFIDTYNSNNNAINVLLMAVVVAAGTQLGSGGNASNLSIELVVEGYGF